MQGEEDWAVMHALYQGHGWSIALWLLTECLVDLGGAPPRSSPTGIRRW